MGDFWKARLPLWRIFTSVPRLPAPPSILQKPGKTLVLAIFPPVAALIWQMTNIKTDKQMVFIEAAK